MVRTLFLVVLSMGAVSQCAIDARDEHTAPDQGQTSASRGWQQYLRPLKLSCTNGSKPQIRLNDRGVRSPNPKI